MNKRNLESSIGSSKKHHSAFEIAERKRYQKLKKSPSLKSDKIYPELDLDGTTISEILRL